MKTTDRGALPAGASGHHGEERQLSDYLRVLYKRRWILVPVFLLVSVVGSVNTLRETPVFEGRTQLLIESDTPKVAKLDQMFDTAGGYYDDDFRQTQYRILQSRTLAKRTLDAMMLWDRPLGNGPEPAASAAVMPLVMRGLRGVYGFAKTAAGADPPTPAPAAPLALDTLKQSDISVKQSGKIDQFLGHLSIVPIKNSRIVEIRYASTDPKFAAAAANAVSKAYIEQNMEFRFNSSKDAADWLGDRLAEQRRALEASEAALQAFKETNGTVSVADSASNIVVQRLTDLNAALTKAKTERINKEALHNQLQAAEGAGNLDTYPAVIANEYIQKLKADLSDLQRQQSTLANRYNERHPEMIKIRSAIEIADAKLRGELAKVVESVRNGYQTALSEERSLQSALESQKGEALSLNRKGIQYGVLLREAESNKQIYESLMQRTKETGISSELRASNVRVVDPAEVPRVPISPNIQRGLTVSFAASVLLALGLAFGLEYLDNRIKTPDQIRHDLGLPFLGMVPALRRKDSHGSPLLNNGVPANFAESVRSLRTSLLFSSAEEGAKTLVVTSTGPGEGKTLVASNVAIALAQAGQQVILIDADMRRPRVHDLFGRDQEPGLSNMLVGKPGDHEHAVQPSDVSGLFTLPAGHIPPNPSELLGAKRFKDLIAGFKDRFDWVIIDSPPVMAVTDACLIAHDATGVLFVVGSEMTNRDTASVALDQLESAQARFVGAVLNRVELKRHSYYYSRYYRKDYVEHYAKSAPS